MLTTVLHLLRRAKKTYDELAERGERVLAGRQERGQRPEPRPTPRPASTAAPAFALPPDVKPGATLSHDELPLPDYDHLTIGSLRARLAKLDPVELVQIRDYERTHANRINVVTMLDNRIAKVAAT